MDIETVIDHVKDSLAVHKFTADGEQRCVGYVSQYTKDKIKEKEIILDALLEKQEMEK